MAADANRIREELRRLGARQERLEGQLRATRLTRARLKDRKRRGALISAARIAAHTRKVKRLLLELAQVQRAIDRRDRELRKIAGKTAGGPTRIAQEILDLVDRGKITCPLPLSTGGTARRDFVQLAQLGRVRCPATGQWITPTGAQVSTLSAILESGRCPRGGQVNALVGGIHRSGSKHYRLLAFDTREADDCIGRQVRKHGGRVFDEDPYHDHDYFGDGGP